MATPAKIESLTIGGRIFTDLANLLVGYAAVTGIQWSGFFKLDGTAIQSGAGTEIHMLAFRAMNQNVSANPITFGHSTVLTGPPFRSAVPAGATYLGGGANTEQWFLIPAGNGSLLEASIDLVCPNNTAPFFHTPSNLPSARCIMFGYEV